MVGFIEPVGTSFQSAREERMEKITSVRMSSGRISFFHHPSNRARVIVAMGGWTDYRRVRSIPTSKGTTLSAYLRAEVRCWSHSISGLLGWVTPSGKGVSVIGGLVRASSHLWISEWPSAKEMPQAP